MMSDIALTFVDGMNADIQMDGADLLTGKELESAIVMSLFTDRRVASDDKVNSSLRGWWGDTFSEITGDKWGSRLWLLETHGRTQEALNLAKNYVLEALQWLIDDKIARQILVEAYWLENGKMKLGIDVLKPGSSIPIHYEFVWQVF